MKEGFRRPNHRDFATSAELKEQRLTGIRHNSITDEQELWVEGKVVLSMSMAMIQLDPQLWHKKYEEIFALNHVETFSNKGN